LRRLNQTAARNGCSRTWPGLRLGCVRSTAVAKACTAGFAFEEDGGRSPTLFWSAVVLGHSFSTTKCRGIKQLNIGIPSSVSFPGFLPIGVFGGNEVEDVGRPPVHALWAGLGGDGVPPLFTIVSNGGQGFMGNAWVLPSAENSSHSPGAVYLVTLPGG